MSYIRLPDRTFTFLPAPYPVPQFGADATNTWPYGRQTALDNVSSISGIPTIISTQYSGTPYVNLAQVTPSNIYVSRILSSDVSSPSTDVFTNDFLAWVPGSPSKGLQWKTVNFICNFSGFPFPSLPDGVIAAQLARIYYKTNNICFPQGSISCATTLGFRFCGATGYINNPNLITLAGAGCPATNNWGVAYVDPTSEGKTITVSDGSGLGVQPFARPQNLYDIFNKTAKNGAVQLSSNRIAYLNDSASGNFGTLLTICRFGTNATPGTTNQCNGEITLNCYPELQIDLQSLVGGNPSISHVTGLWSDRNGLLACLVTNSSFRKVVLIQYPGPVVQVIAGAPNAECYVFVYNGYIGAAYLSGVTSGIQWSTTQIDMTYNFSVPVKPIINNVSQSNIVENISARGF